MDAGVENGCGAGADPNEARLYPAEHHFRIIVEGTSDARTAIEAILSGYEMTAPLSTGGQSSGSRYQSLGVSVKLPDRASHHQLDAARRAVVGVRILL